MIVFSFVVVAQGGLPLRDVSDEAREDSSAVGRRSRVIHTWANGQLGVRQRPVQRHTEVEGHQLVPEVGVAIDEQQPMTTAPPQSQDVAEQDRAIVAEHERNVADIEDFTARVGQGMRFVP
jgi:hypothetical protein